jgi:peptidyl-prolyl cis-trans isomerase SurA
MKKKWLVVIITVFMMNEASSQTLFTYGKYSVDAKEFLRAYNKNNTTVAAKRSKALRDYLDLYIASRLKIREAYERGYDTLPQQKEELANLRVQIIENYMSDPKIFNRLLNEALQRSRKDLHLAHIFVSVRSAGGELDTIAAKQKINKAYEALKKGDNFSKVALQYSDDPFVKKNNGDMGFITVFTLPYEFENIAYSLPVNKFSPPYKSKAGYHIFKNLAERPAAGKIKAAQILLAIPPGSDEATIKQISQRADSIYNRLMKGDDFSKLASQFSNDYISANSEGMIPEFGTGQYEPVFENIVLGLKDGSVSKPFLTSHGYHIVKRISQTALQVSDKNKTFMDELRQKVEQSERMKIGDEVVFNKVIQKVPLQKFPYRSAELWALTDSILDSKPAGITLKMKRETPLFKLDDKTYYVMDWINYAQSFRYRNDGSGVKPYPQVMDEYIRFVTLQYYRNNLEAFNEEFRNQVNEFRDGNLFFEIMQREIWGRMQNDSAALMAYYEKNKNKYTWKQSADAVVFFCSDQKTAQLFYDQLKVNPSLWRVTTQALGEKVVADSARYELNQIPNGSNSKIKPGMITTPVINKTDNSISFAYIYKVYMQPGLRSFEEAKGLLINDYQTELEKQWVQELKQKYPVHVNENVLQSLLK